MAPTEDNGEGMVEMGLAAADLAELEAIVDDTLNSSTRSVDRRSCLRNCIEGRELPVGHANQSVER